MITTHECHQKPDAIFIHPGCEEAALAGNATIALEIVEELPDVDCIVVPYGSGSVCTGVACGVRELAKESGNENVSIKLYPSFYYEIPINLVRKYVFYHCFIIRVY